MVIIQLNFNKIDISKGVVDMGRGKVVANEENLKIMSNKILLGYFEHVLHYYNEEPSEENIKLHELVSTEILSRMSNGR
jgi:hypothetical protein